MNLNELFLVRCHYEPFMDSCRQDHFIPKTDLAKFIRASYKLHVNPARNPHSLVSCVKYTAIYVYDMAQFQIGQYWWSTPSLEADGTGANVIDFTHCHCYYFGQNEFISDEAFETAIAKV